MTRRTFFHVGSLPMVALSLPKLLAAPSRPRPAKACILFYLEGGPAHQDLWDMKPDAPLEVRGEFHPTATKVPGLQVCEHLPRFAGQAHHLAYVRSVSHTMSEHNSATYYALSGEFPIRGGRLIQGVSPENMPTYGAVLAKLRPTSSPLPPFVHLPDIMSNSGYDIAGQSSGFLGAAYEPLVAGDPSRPDYQVPGIGLPVEVSGARFSNRLNLARTLDRTAALADSEATSRFGEFSRQALSMVTSTATRRAFDLDSESASVRTRYGLEPGNNRVRGAREFGGLPHLGQCMLLARRLIESGVRLVTVCTGRSLDQTWDTHRDHFPLLKRSILPMVDQAFSALIEDLAERQLLDDTLVVAMGEFGRTPRVGQVTTPAGADAGGRDHWPHCYTVMFGGAGINPGAIHGASDRDAAYPAADAVRPEDIAATIYHAMGVDPNHEIIDPLGRPHVLGRGVPILRLWS